MSQLSRATARPGRREKQERGDVMSNTQIPLWVTLALAVIALFGPIGGAWIGGTITARRDDRRWDREAAREDLRWDREQRASMTTHWSDSRLEYYAQYLLLHKKLENKILYGTQFAENQETESVSSSLYGEIRELIDEIDYQKVLVSVVGSDDLQECLTAIGNQVGAIAFFAPALTISELRGEANKLRLMSGDLRAAVRRDLGVVADSADS